MGWLFLVLAIAAVCVVFWLTREGGLGDDIVMDDVFPEPPVEPVIDVHPMPVEPMPPPVDETVFDQVDDEIVEPPPLPVEGIPWDSSGHESPGGDPPPVTEVSESTNFSFDSGGGSDD